MRLKLSACILLAHIFWESRALDMAYTPVLGTNGTRCYDDMRRPQRCIPGFENPAFNNLIEATNTCGENGPIEYCVQTGITGIRKACTVCNPDQHSARYLTDDSKDQQTWWQSETMNENIQYPNTVNLTLNLGKAFDITYVRIWFHSPRPESFAIYKRTCETCPWVPYQYYSATCRDTYSLPDSTHIGKGEDTRALCTSEYSDISPLKDGNIAFATLEYRPSAYNFDASPELQEWVTATDIRISLNRLNTFGDEVFGATEVLRSYFYAIVEVSVGARCKCNGHASECVISTGIDGSQRRVCKCEHYTAGADCNECLPFFNDAPWRRASEKNAHECKPCNCNNFSNRCYFDNELYKKTGHGGHCLDCADNRDGPNCERCKENYYQNQDQYCQACDCDPEGSRNLQCNSEGKCFCRPGVTGDKCDMCDENFYNFGPDGCKSCGCSDAGAVKSIPKCDAYTGACTCKDNVEGKRCRECKPGYFNLDEENEFGCTPCFCYGHSSECQSVNGYARYQIESMFTKGNERWRAMNVYNTTIDMQYNALSHSIGVSAPDNQDVYFVAPEKFLGDQRASYNQLLQFTLRTGEGYVVPGATDIILEGAGYSITNHIFAQGNELPSIQNHEYKFRLHEHPSYAWNPRLSARAFMSILTNLTAIKIRATYAQQNAVGFLQHVRLETASRGVAGKPALWVEQCSCPEGYIGQFCESCAPGYRHSPSIGPFMSCVPCNCNNHADNCDSETGRCICKHNTTGSNCDLCARGFYGNALGGTFDDCQPCGCPNGGACIQIEDDTVCVECPVGYTGSRCDVCSDGYFGDPTGRYGPKTPCQACECNLNIDTNAIGNCNTTTGECLKCVHNTGGSRCETCLPGFYGDALGLPKGDCKPCQCSPAGSVESDSGPVCDQLSGMCKCKLHVEGRNCDVCQEGYYNIQSGEGCSPCNCDSIGSLNHTCSLYTGQCYCRPGITGLRCDQCEPFKYGFSVDGCKACECDYIGSKDPQCDSFGQCPCLDNVEGRRCDRCKENKYDRQRGCVDCPPCYNLVQEASANHFKKLQQLKTILDEIERNPTVIDDDKFEEQLNDIKEDVHELADMAKEGLGGDEKSLKQKLDNIIERQKAISRTLEGIEESILLAKEQDYMAKQNITKTDETIKLLTADLEKAEQKLLSDGADALEHARQRAKAFGQHSRKMTEIAQDGRKLADVLDDQADRVVTTAIDAKNVSTMAYELAKNASDQQKNITQEMRALRSDVTNTENKLNRVKQLTEDAHKKALDNKDKALTLLSEARNLILPEIDIEKLKKDAEDTKMESKKLLEEANELMNEREQMLRDVNELILSANDLLKGAVENQDTTNEILADIDSARAKAADAVASGDKTLKDAKAMHETLTKFDKKVQESKDAALKALDEIPEIERLIEDAQLKNDKAEISLGVAKDNAKQALVSAENASQLAKNAIKHAEKMEKEATMLNKNVAQLKNEAHLMADRVVETRNEFNRLAQQTENNGTLINEAREKVGRAQKDSQEATKKVNDIRKDVEAIMKELENVPYIDDEELNRLEQQLKRAEQRVRDENIVAMLEKMQNEQKDQLALIDTYNKEIDTLRKEVENIEQIAHALPVDCFKKLPLEV
ncbi:laminin subunit gamma-1 isoform X1 [Atheta coriaria]|uniref:laminin subunit gamma-1 isoform X1 n=1 Tax=Dalotia coriaria TaxID=877792 RepID=UPI0031F3640D